MNKLDKHETNSEEFQCLQQVKMTRFDYQTLLLLTVNGMTLEMLLPRIISICILKLQAIDVNNINLDL